MGQFAFFHRAARSLALASLLLSLTPLLARAGSELTEPPVFASKNGVLDLLLVAEGTRPVAEIRHVAIYQLRGAAPGRAVEPSAR